MAVPIPPPPGRGAGDVVASRARLPARSRSELSSLASVALVASASGLFVAPVVGPAVGIVLSCVVLLSEQDRAPTAATTRAILAVAVGAGAIALPVGVVLALSGDEGPSALVALGLIVALVVGLAANLGGLHVRRAAQASVGAVLAVVVVAGTGIAAIRFIVWIFVTFVTEIYRAFFG